MVIFGPIADVAREKLSREEPDLFELASMSTLLYYRVADFHRCNSVALTPLTLFAESEPRDAGTDQRSSGIIRLHTIKQIIDRVSKHNLLRDMRSILGDLIPDCFIYFFYLSIGQACCAGHHPERCRQAELRPVVPHSRLPKPG